MVNLIIFRVSGKWSLSTTPKFYSAVAEAGSAHAQKASSSIAYSGKFSGAGKEETNKTANNHISHIRIQTNI